MTQINNIREKNTKELKAIAKELKVANWWTLRKENLIEEIEISRMKIDIADGYDKAGFEDVSWGEDFKLSCWLDGDDIIIHLADWNSDSYGQGGTIISVDEFMNMTREEFDSLVGQVNAYGMTYEDEFGED